MASPIEHARLLRQLNRRVLAAVADCDRMLRHSRRAVRKSGQDNCPQSSRYRSLKTGIQRVMPEFKLVCGPCHAEGRIVCDADGPAAVCPTCGQRDTVEDALRIAGDQAARAAAVKMNDLFRRVSTNGRSEFEPGPDAQVFKWHAAIAPRLFAGKAAAWN